MLARVLAFGTIFIGTLSALFFFSGLPAPLPEQSPSAYLLGQLIYDVGSVDFPLVDDSRPTASNGEFEGLDHRPLETTAWFPMIENQQVAPGLHPVVIYAHGFSSGKIGGKYMAEYLAAQGYIVIAPDFPLTHMSAPGGSLAQDVINQPADISFLIDKLEVWNKQTSSPFYQRLDMSRLGLVGVSLGGMAAILTSHHPDYVDQRIKLLVSVAGVSSMFKPQFYQRRSLPTLLIASPQDALVSYEENALPMAQAIPGALLVSIEGGTHTGFSEFSRYMRWLPNPDRLSCSVVESKLGDRPVIDSWFDSLGGDAMGVRKNLRIKPCADKLPMAINPVLQHWVTQLAVYGFLQQHFGDTKTERNTAQAWLNDYLSEDFPFVSVSRPAGG